jgi:hypothetical protein
MAGRDDDRRAGDGMSGGPEVVLMLVPVLFLAWLMSLFGYPVW